MHSDWSTQVLFSVIHCESFCHRNTQFTRCLVVHQLILFFIECHLSRIRCYSNDSCCYVTSKPRFPQECSFQQINLSSFLLLNNFAMWTAHPLTFIFMIAVSIHCLLLKKVWRIVWQAEVSSCHLSVCGIILHYVQFKKKGSNSNTSISWRRRLSFSTLSKIWKEAKWRWEEFFYETIQEIDTFKFQ